MSLSVIATLAPLLMKLKPVKKLLGTTDEDSEKNAILGKAVDLAKDFFGTSSTEAIKQQLESGSGASAFEETLAKQEHELELALLNDRANARKMYSNGSARATTDHIAKHIMKYNVYWVIGLVLSQLFAMYFLRDYAQLLAIIGNVVGFVVAQLLAERGSVVGFYFGSSEGSKSKDKIKDN